MALPIGRRLTPGRAAFLTFDEVKLKAGSISWLVISAIALASQACRSNEALPEAVGLKPAVSAQSAGSPAAGSSPAAIVPPAVAAPTPTTASSTPVLSSASPTLKVKSCEPCRFDASPSLSFELRFKPVGDRGVSAIEVTPLFASASEHATLTPQRLELEDCWSPSGEFLLQGIDTNFDGVLDLGFGPVLGTPNLTLDYWTVEAKRGGLERLGKLTNLSIDAKTHEVKTYEKGGHAGLENESKTYRWEVGKLIPVRATSQAPAQDGKGYLQTTQRFKKGRVVDQKPQPVQAP